MKIVQVLPELNSGGVERGTVDFARYLVTKGHHSMVISNGGRLVRQLLAEDSEHHQFPVHKKSILSLLKVNSLARLISQLAPDIIHVRSRIPAWMTYLALRRLPHGQKPHLVSTFHGLYSVNAYSAIMGSGESVIAISDCVKNYIVDNYPKIDSNKVRVIHRGVDTELFNRGFAVSWKWRERLRSEHAIDDRTKLILMPGRLSPWKGQLEFIEVIAELIGRNQVVHGLIVGEVTPGKESYLKQLIQKVDSLGLEKNISFLGHRADMKELYAVADVVVNLSRDPEPFGRTVIEALAMGTPVAAYDEGGPAEVLRQTLPRGLVPQKNPDKVADTIVKLMQKPETFDLPVEFTLQHQAEKTLEAYQQLIGH